jgi:hypothetical protein
MPKTQNKPDIDVHRFASVLAGFDTCNDNDQEAVTKGLALRRMAKTAGMRIVDLMELPELRQAIDDQMLPVRRPDPAFKEALEHVASLQEELTERTRDVAMLAERLGRQEEEMERMRREYAGARSPRMQPAPVRSGGNSSPSASRAVLPAWGVQAGAAVMALAMLLCSLFGNSHGGNGNGLGNGQGAPAAVVHQNSAVRSVPKRSPLHYRKRRSAPGADAR